MRERVFPVTRSVEAVFAAERPAAFFIRTVTAVTRTARTAFIPPEAAFALGRRFAFAVRAVSASGRGRLLQFAGDPVVVGEAVAASRMLVTRGDRSPGFFLFAVQAVFASGRGRFLQIARGPVVVGEAVVRPCVIPVRGDPLSGGESPAAPALRFLYEAGFFASRADAGVSFLSGLVPEFFFKFEFVILFVSHDRISFQMLSI